MTLAARLKAAMEAAGLGQSELARRASTPGKKVHQQNVQQILRGAEKSRHLAALAQALGVTFSWLATGEGPRLPNEQTPEALLIGKVGAGAEIVRFDHPDVLAGIPLPFGLNAPNAAEIEGDSQYPLQPGWLIFYGPENQGVPENLLGKMCVVQTKDGTTLLKIPKRGSKRGVYRLESWNAPPREDVKLTWAAKVLDIRPR